MRVYVAATNALVVGGRFYTPCCLYHRVHKFLPHCHCGLPTLASPIPFLPAEESAREHAEGFVGAAHKLVGMIDKLYEGVEMPRQAGWLVVCARCGPESWWRASASAWLVASWDRWQSLPSVHSPLHASSDPHLLLPP